MIHQIKSRLYKQSVLETCSNVLFFIGCIGVPPLSVSFLWAPLLRPSWSVSDCGSLWQRFYNSHNDSLLLCNWKSYYISSGCSAVIDIDHKPQQKHVAIKMNYCVHTWLRLCWIAVITSLDAYQCLPVVECSWLHKSQLRPLPVLKSDCIASSNRENRPSGRDSY